MRLKKRIDKLNKLRYGDALGEHDTFLAWSQDGEQVWVADMPPKELLAANHRDFQDSLDLMSDVDALRLVR